MYVKKIFNYLIGLVLFLAVVYLISLPLGMNKRWYITFVVYTSGYIVNEYMKYKKKK